jgi:hypothetical protein
MLRCGIISPAENAFRRRTYCFRHAIFCVLGLRMRRILFPLLLILTLPASAADDGLKPVADMLVAIRGTQGINKLRDAGPELTPIKHALRDWIEQALPPPTNDLFGTPQDDKLAAAEARLNAAITDAGLTCQNALPERKSCTDDPLGKDNARGYLGRIELSYLEDSRYLLMKTNIGVFCGYDESAYIYERQGDHWRFLTQNEQNDYSDKAYNVQNFLAVRVSPADVAWNEPAPPPLVLTLGAAPWCSSNWQALYTRLWRTSPTNPSPAALLSKDDSLYIGMDPAVAEGSLTKNDVLIEFRDHSIDSGILIRPHVLHYRISAGDTLERIAPVALNPNDFVDEWLTSPWDESLHWSGQKDIGALEKAYRATHSQKNKDFVFGEFDGNATRCRRDQTLWQVAFAPDDGTGSGPAAHFLVRWTAPYTFMMMGAQDRQYPGCDLTVSQPDSLGTLFPLQDWRY